MKTILFIGNDAQLEKKTRQMGREERWGHCTGFKLVSQLKVEEGKVPLLQLETKTYFEF